MNRGKRLSSPSPARLVAEDWNGRPGRSVLLALAGSLLLHAGLVLLAPDEIFGRIAVEPRELDRLEVILADPEEPLPEEFILTNPDVASNPPDETHFFSDRDQQAAQETEADDEDLGVPSVEGEEPEPNQNIVRSEDVFPSLEEAMAEALAEADAEVLAPLPERLIPGFEPSEEPEGLEVPVTPDEGRDLEEEPVIGVDLGQGEETVEMAENADATGTGEGTERVMPRPRPVLPQFSRGPVGAREGAATRVGQVAVDANFSEYGDYLARMLDVIVRQWHLLAWDSLQGGEMGMMVAVSFRVDAEGRIQGLEVLQSTAGLVATLICQDAIASRQPYGEWTPDMKEVLGEEQTVKIRFFYR